MTLVVLSDIRKRHGAQLLFEDFSFSIEEGERLGLIGPNGAGKSTLLKILAGLEEVDDGSITRRRDLRISYCAQTADFNAEHNILDLALESAGAGAVSEAERQGRARSALGAFDLDDHEIKVGALSGGQRKRLQLALAVAQQPDLLLLDEPTNHLDIETILQLERYLQSVPFSWVVVSHDRWFLENSVDRIAEINPMYPGGVLVAEGGYGKYLERRDQFRQSAERQRESLENKVRNEQAWLRQGVKARGTKARHRIGKAHELMDTLSLVRVRGRERKVELGFEASERKTKRLVEITNASVVLGEKPILTRLNLKLLAGQALGVLGRNASGKTTFIRLLCGQVAPQSGTVKHAADLSISWFRQIDNTISPKLPLKEVLAPEGDSVVYRGRSVHVATWAKRFAFSFEQLDQPYGTLSGGEQARARIARLMLETPDVLVLDEPTNDLDIPTLELLEQSLLEFPGALVLVTHDRFLINRVCTSFIGLDGRGNSEMYADYLQWQRELQGKDKASAERSTAGNAAPAARERPRTKRLSYKEQREFDNMEESILEAEAEVEGLEEKLNSEQVQADPDKLQQVCEELATAQKLVSDLYSRWAELEEKQK